MNYRLVENGNHHYIVTNFPTELTSFTDVETLFECSYLHSRLIQHLKTIEQIEFQHFPPRTLFGTLDLFLLSLI